MGWETTRYRPPIRNPKGKIAASPLAPLSRLIGCVSFLLTGFAVAKLAQKLLGLPPSFWDGKWEPRETVAVGIIVLLSIVGGLMGFALGLKVSVSNQSLTRLACILWHFLANGQIVCFILLELLAQKEQRHLGIGDVLPILGGFAAALTASGLILFFAGQFREHERSRPALQTIVVLLFSVAAGVWLRPALQLPREAAVLFSVVVGVGAWLLSARSIQRDYAQMREMNQIRRSS